MLDKMSSTKAKVTGVSKTNIPTLLHPKTPYFVLLLEDENGNKWVQKSAKEYKIGDDFKFETSQDKKSVAIFKVKYDISEAIRKVIDLIGGIQISQTSKILILPSLISPKHPYFCDNTSPQFLENMIQYLTGKGASAANIKVLAQSFDETPIEASAQKSQLLSVCLKNKITPLDLAKTSFVKKGELEISEEAFNSDLILNLPILKVGQIGATNNLFKFLKKESFLGLKYLFSEQEMAEKLLAALPGCLTVAEAISIQKTTGLTGFLGLVLAGFNPLNLDRVFAEITMVEPLPEALGKVKIDDIPIMGRNIMEVQYEIEKF